MSAKADSAFGQRPAEEVGAVWGNMMGCPRVHHPSRSRGSVEGNGQIFIIVNLFYLSSTNMRVNRFGGLCAVPFSLFFLLLLLHVFFLFVALISSVPGLLAIKAFDFAFVCLITLLVTTLRGRLSTSCFRGAEAILGEDTELSGLSVGLVRGTLASTKGGFSLVEVSYVLK